MSKNLLIHVIVVLLLSYDTESLTITLSWVVQHFSSVVELFEQQETGPRNPQFWPDYPDDQEDEWRNLGDL